MVTFHVADMTCGHCASAISRAVAGVDKAARLDIGIAQKLVRVSSTASATELAEAIREAGYSPEEVQEVPTPPVAPRASGCGCGCGSRKAAAVDTRQAAVAVPGPCCG